MRRLPKAESAFTQGRRGRVALALAMTCALWLICATSASATLYVDSFFGNLTGTGTVGGQFNEPRGVAVNDSTGALYVVDARNNRVQQLDASGAFVRAWGKDVIVTTVNEQQSLKVNATAGTYTLTFNGSTTAPIAFNVTAANLDNALDVLPSIGGDANVAVAGSQAAGYTITFQGTLAAANQPQITVDASGLTGTAEVTTIVDGANSATTGGSGTGFEICTVAAHCKTGVVGTEGGMFSFSSGGACNGSNPCEGGIAVNQVSGDVYVTDSRNLRVQQFSATGSFVRAWGGDVVQPGGVGEQFGPPLDEQQTVTLQSALPPITGGTFTLTFNGNTTTALSFDATAAAVDAALEALPSVGAGNVVVGGGPGPNSAWTVGFTGTLGAADVPSITGNGSALVDGCGVGVCTAVGVSTTQPGGPSPALEVCSVAAQCKAGAAAPNGGAFASSFPSATSFTGHPAVAPVGAPNAGNVVVADPGNRRVQEFTASGAFVRAFGADVSAPAGGTGFEICTVSAECKAAPAGSGPGFPAGRFGNQDPQSVAVDSTGAIYATEAEFAGGNFRMQKFTPQAGPPALAPSVFAAATLSDTSDGRAPNSVAVNPATNRVFVIKGFAEGASTCPNGSPSALFERRVLELTPAGVLVDDQSLACAGFTLSTPTFGLALRPSTGEAFVSSRFGAPGNIHRVYVLDADGITPAIASIQPATSVTGTSAQLNGTVNPNSVDNVFAPTTWKIQLSLDGASWQTAGQGSIAAAGISPVAVSASATNLLPNTEYELRILTQKPLANPEIVSAGATFKTDAVKADVSTVRADSITESSARLTGRINPHSTQTTYRFEWGEQGGPLDQVVPVPDGVAGSGPQGVFVAEALTGLSPATTYEFRIVATSETEGETLSAVKAFTTAATAPQPLGRGYELVSPSDKVAGTGVGRWYAGVGSMAPSGFAAWEGERFAAMGSFGATLQDDAAHGFANDWALAERISDSVGWRSHSPITHPSHRAQHASFMQVGSSSEDLSSFFWLSNSTPFFFDGLGVEASLFDAGYLSDWGAPPSNPTRWELFGPGDLSLVDLPAAALVKKLWDVKLSADGSTAVGLTGLGEATPRLPLIHGLAGPGDPTARSFGDLVSGRSVYLADMTGGLTDEFETGERHLVNVCTGEGAERTVLPAVGGSGDLAALECPSPSAGRDARLVSDHGASLRVAGDRPANNGSLAGMVSEDGSRVFFMAPDPAATGIPNGISSFCSGTLCPPQLFVRQRTPDGDVVRWISKAEDGLFGTQDATLTGAIRFEGATPDGDKVFFRTNSPLTTDDPNGTGAPVSGGVKIGNASGSSWDLYRYDFPDDPNADPGEGELTRISAGPDGAGDCNSPLPKISSGADDGTIGALRAASADGARAYFTCTAPLPGVAAPTDPTRLTAPGGTTATTGQTNLYLYDAGLPQAERWRFVARLPRETVNAPVGDPGSFDACASAGTIPKSALGSNNDDANTNFTGWREANCVNATSDGAFVTFMTTGRLTLDDPPVPSTGDMYGYDAEADELIRITADQGGGGEPEPCVTVSATPFCWGTGSAESTPEIVDQGRVNTALGVATNPLDPGDRIAFFQSPSQLVPEDEDDGYDVYQWRNGDLSLISSGAPDSDHALYKGNDRSGRNVYFVTRDRLTWQDRDAVADVYTARVGGGISEPVSPPPCELLAGGCQGASSKPPAPSGAASSAFSGSGNVVKQPKPKRCARGKVRRGDRCVVKKKAKKKAAKGRANHNRRTDR